MRVMQAYLKTKPTNKKPATNKNQNHKCLLIILSIYLNIIVFLHLSVQHFIFPYSIKSITDLYIGTGVIAEVNSQSSLLSLQYLFQMRVLSPSLPFFLRRMFEFDDLDTELVQTFRLRILMLLFLFIAIRSVELQYEWLIYYQP